MRYILFLFLLFQIIPAFATEEEEIGHIYGALGEIYGQSSVRAGTDSWEAGLLNRKSLGIVFLDYSDSMYSAIGPIISFDVIPGLFAALGYEWTFWGFTSFRIEANTGHSIDNYSSSEINIGLSLFW